MMRRISLIVLLTAGLVVALVAWRQYQSFLKIPLQLPQAGLLYTVTPGVSLRVLARDLEQRGVLANALYLRLLARIQGQASQIKAGEYLIAQGTNPRQLLVLLTSGKVHQYALTLLEGWTFQQVLQAIRHHEAITQTLQGLSMEQIMERLGHPGQHPEGWFFPDTYHFPRGTTDLAFLARAYAAMQHRLSKAWEQRAPDLPLKTPYEALTLASIVERETGLASERPEIAGVFVRRLRKGMKLQTDPTVIYGMGDAFSGNLRRQDLETDTPYNTYIHAGLTPTPICMPGADAIHAALHPAPGNNLYFVAKGDGSHHFSPSLEEHNRAVRRFQLGQR